MPVTGQIVSAWETDDTAGVAVAVMEGTERVEYTVEAPKPAGWGDMTVSQRREYLLSLVAQQRAPRLRARRPLAGFPATAAIPDAPVASGQLV